MTAPLLFYTDWKINVQGIGTDIFKPSVQTKYDKGRKDAINSKPIY